MDWQIWWRKTWRGLLVAVSIGAVAYAIASLTDILKNPAAPVWLAAAGPVALHLLGVLQNYLKHRGTTS